jgi:hypothetical protein
MKGRKDGIVKKGGVANEDAEIGDVTRDTYGFAEGHPVRDRPDERIAEADRAAGAVGVPGVAPPESDESEKAREEEFRDAEVAGDRTASRRDVEKVVTPQRRTTRNSS